MLGCIYQAYKLLLKKQVRFIAKSIIIIFNQFFSINQNLKNPAYFLILIFSYQNKTHFAFLFVFLLQPKQKLQHDRSVKGKKMQ